jgi:hypothetical protein
MYYILFLDHLYLQEIMFLPIFRIDVNIYYGLEKVVKYTVMAWFTNFFK